MNSIQLVILAITAILILAAVLILWRKGLLRQHKKKIVAVAFASILLGSGVVIIMNEPPAGFPSTFFGSRVVGTSFTSFENYVVAGRFRMNNTLATPNNITAYIYTSINNKTVSFGIFNDADVLVAKTNTRNVTAMSDDPDTPAWIKLSVNWTLNASVLQPNRYYNISAWSGSGGGVNLLYYNPTSGPGVNRTTTTRKSLWAWTTPESAAWTAIDTSATASIYCNWTAVSTWSNRAPTFSEVSPSNGSVGNSLLCPTTVKVSDLDGNSSLVCFWYSTVLNSSTNPGSWIKAQQSTVVANATASDDIASWFNKTCTAYWWKITARNVDGGVNSSAVYCLSGDRFNMTSGTLSASIGIAKRITTWSAIRGNTSGDSITASSENAIEVTNETPPAPYGYDLYRHFLGFDTSGIPDTAVITNVTIGFLGTDGYAGWNFSIQKWITPTGKRALETYNNITLNPTSENIYTVIKSWTDSGWNLGYFNTTGRNEINKTGFTYLCLRNYDYDTMNNDPEFNNGQLIGWDNLTNQPYLIIEWTTEITNTAPTLSSPSPSNNSFDNIKKPILAVTIGDIDDVTQDMNITWSNNSSGTWQTFGLNQSVNNGTYRQEAVNFTIPGTRYYWRIILNDGAGGWDNHTYILTLDNDTVWRYSSGYPHCFFDLGDDTGVTNIGTRYSLITYSSSYIMFNTTGFMVTSTNRTNVTIKMINESITGAAPSDELLDFYAYTKGGTVWFNITGFDPSAVYSVKKNGNIIGNYTANVTGAIAFSNAAWSAPHFEIILKTSSASDVYSDTIRNNGMDYFIWLGKNTTAYYVRQNMTGLDEAAESISIWNRTSWSTSTGLWQTYNGTKTGVNWTVHTFQVIRTVMTDTADDQIILMLSNPDMDYTASRSYTLMNLTKNKGYNYSAYNKEASTTLSAISSSIGLTTGEFCGRWNRTTFTWDLWISGFGLKNYQVSRWDVIITKVGATRTWTT